MMRQRCHTEELEALTRYYYINYAMLSRASHEIVLASIMISMRRATISAQSFRTDGGLNKNGTLPPR